MFEPNWRGLYPGEELLDGKEEKEGKASDKVPVAKSPHRPPLPTTPATRVVRQTVRSSISRLHNKQTGDYSAINLRYEALVQSIQSILS
jgi:hypothetical protein